MEPQGFNKIVEIEPYFPTGEMSIQPVVLWANGKPHYEQLTKHASVGSDYFKSIQPVPGHSIVYVLALGAWETYGENRNGDGFPEFAYKDPAITEKDSLVQHYKTFEQGHNFRHHMNRSPKKAVGKVLKAFWNPSMHRVELLVDLEDAKAPDLAERIAAGEFPPVSMGTRVKYDVCVLPDTLVRTTTGYLPIKDIDVGTKVRTHTGKIQKVTAHYVRDTTEDLYDIQISGTPNILSTTGQHPFLIIRKEVARTCKGTSNGVRARHRTKLNESQCSRCNQDLDLSMDWIAAEDLTVGDYSVTPVDSCAEKDVIGSDLATVLGYYMGNGSIIWYEHHEERYDTTTPRVREPGGFSISMNLQHESNIQRLCAALTKLNTTNNWRRYDYPDKSEASICINDPELAAKVLHYAGHLSKEKRLNEEVFTWSRAEKLALIDGYIDTDGSVSAQKRSLRILSTNPGLLLDIQRLSLSCEVPGIVYNAGSPISFDKTTRIPCFGILFSSFDLKAQNSQSTKVASLSETVTYSKHLGFYYKNYWCSPVKSIAMSPLSDETKCRTVHNLAVENDESYIAEGVAVHNCSICLNRAPTRAQYCDHLKFQMRDVIDGKKVAALNPSPRFFDISWVFRPADATAFMMKKVAENTQYEVLSGACAGEYLDRMETQKAAAHKLAVINKVVQGIPVDVKSEGMDAKELRALQQIRPLALEAGRNTPDFPDEFLREMAKHPLPNVVSTLEATGLMRLSTPEVTKIVMYKNYPNSEVPEEVLSKTVGAQQGILELFEDFPQIINQLEESGALQISDDKVDPKIAEAVLPFLEKRSGMGQYLKRRLVPDKYKDDIPYGTPLSITDPATGQQYNTTRGAAIRAHDEVVKRNLYKTVGGAALLGGAYKLIGSGLNRYRGGKYRALKPVAALGLGALGISQLPDMGKHYMTDQGVPIPINTELAKSAGAERLALPALGTLGLMTGMAHDYQSRLRSGVPLEHPQLPLSRRILDQAESFAANHPILTGVGGTLGLYGLSRVPVVRRAGRIVENLSKPLLDTGKTIAQGAKETLRGLSTGVKQSSVLEDITSTPDSAVTLPTVNLDKLAEWLGWAILEG